MPNWKKVIVSGSDASLNSLNVSNGITGSLFGTASFANYATSASYALTASSAQNTSDILIYVKNSSGAQINKGKVVRIAGAVGDNPLISTASYENDNNSANTLGITNENIANDSFGYVMTEGTLLGINTNGFTAGQLLYLGATGSIIGTAPVAPLHAVRLGQVLRTQQNAGSIYVRIDNGYEIGELHDIRDTSTTSSYGDLLVRSGSVWTNSKQLTGSYGITGSLGISGSTGTLFSSNADTIIFTGSAAISGTLNVTDGITGTLFGTSSYAITASYALNAGAGGGGTNTVPYIHPTTLTGSILVPDNHNGLLMSPVSISGSVTIGSGSSLLTIGPITSSMSASFASTSSYSTNIIGAANYIPKFTGGNTLSSSIMYESANGIGINDTSATHKLQVSGDISTYNSSNTLNLTKYSLIGGLNTTVTGSETNQYANTGIYGSLGYSATTGTFTPLNKSFVSAVFGQFSKSGGGNISGNATSFAAGINLSGTGNVTTIAGFRAYAPLQSFALPSFTGTLTNYIGLLVDDITGTTDVGSRITNKYGIYQTGTSDKNYFAGSTTIDNVLQLGQQNPLPSGTDGQLAVSASNLYFFSGSAWNKISFA
jgi:hypothetical protein